MFSVLYYLDNRDDTTLTGERVVYQQMQSQQTTKTKGKTKTRTKYANVYYFNNLHTLFGMINHLSAPHVSSFSIDSIGGDISQQLPGSLSLCNVTITQPADSDRCLFNLYLDFRGLSAVKSLSHQTSHSDCSVRGSRGF